MMKEEECFCEIIIFMLLIDELDYFEIFIYGKLN